MILVVSGTGPVTGPLETGVLGLTALCVVVPMFVEVDGGRGLVPVVGAARLDSHLTQSDPL